jgi:hypothetical protein
MRGLPWSVFEPVDHGPHGVWQKPNAARGPSDAPLIDVRTPIGAHVGANHAALGADHPAT